MHQVFPTIRVPQYVIGRGGTKQFGTVKSALLDPKARLFQVALARLDSEFAGAGEVKSGSTLTLGVSLSIQRIQFQ